MSTPTESPMSAEAIENEYISVVSKRIRAYKKKIDRINALDGKKNLASDQIALCANLETYQTILNELQSLKDRFTEIAGQEPVVMKKEEIEVTEEVKPEETPVEVAVVEETVVIEEPAAEEPVAEEPVTEEPATEEPATEEPVTEEPVTEEAVETAPAPAEEKKGDKKRHYRRSNEKSNERREGNPRRGRKDNTRRNGTFLSRKDREDGWTVPKKVVYINNKEQ